QVGCIIGMIVIVVVGVVCEPPAKEVDPNLGEVFWIILLVALSIFVILLHHLARSANAPDANELMARDARPRALFVRSFSNDTLWALKGSGGLEQDVAEILGAIAPVVAIG